VGVVDDQDGRLPLGDLDQVGQRGEVALHTEHTVCDDEPQPRVGVFSQLPPQEKL
jgi:hypothetical protein